MEKVLYAKWSIQTWLFVCWVSAILSLTNMNFNDGVVKEIIEAYFDILHAGLLWERGKSQF